MFVGSFFLFVFFMAKMWTESDCSPAKQAEGTRSTVGRSRSEQITLGGCITRPRITSAVELPLAFSSPEESAVGRLQRNARDSSESASVQMKSTRNKKWRKSEGRMFFFVFFLAKRQARFRPSIQSSVEIRRFFSPRAITQNSKLNSQLRFQLGWRWEQNSH